MLARRLLLALLLAIFVSGVFTFWLSKKLANQKEGKSHQLQYIATFRNLDAGTTIKSSDLQRISWPESVPLEGAFQKPEDVIGRVLLFPLAKGEPIIARQISASENGIGLSSKIPSGMRAISLKSNEVVGVAGFLFPGTHIDVLVTYHLPSSAETITSTVLQDVEILATGQKTQPDPEGKANQVDVVTILVTPPDAEKVVLASSQGTVHFVLRNASDHIHVTDQPIQISELGKLTNSAPTKSRNISKPHQPTETKAYSVDIQRGDKHTVETF